MSIFRKLSDKVRGPDSPDESTVRFEIGDFDLTVREVLENGFRDAGLTVDLSDDADPVGWELSGRFTGKNDEDAMKRQAAKWKRDGLLVTDPDEGAEQQDMQEGDEVQEESGGV